jgi:hypothetical protein
MQHYATQRSLSSGADNSALTASRDCPDSATAVNLEQRAWQSQRQKWQVLG